jgi:lysophospholipase L1-like esterase
MPRAERCFQRFGYTVLRSSVPVPLGHTDNWSLLTLGLREYAAWSYYWVRGRFGAVPERALVPTVAPAATASAAPAPGASTMSAPAPLAHPAGPIVILGASYAKGWAPRLAGRPVINSGVAGQQSFELLARFDGDVLAHQPRAVIIWGFINDVFRTPRGTIGEGLARARESISAIVARSRAAGIEPILATEVTIRYKAGIAERLAVLAGTILGRPGYHDYVNRHVLDTNAWMREYAAREGIFLLDLQPPLADASGLRKAAFAKEDGSHLPPAAYDALSAYAVPRLEQHLAAP